MTQPVMTVTGITEIYDSTLAKEFAEAKDYPIAWEIMYRNDKGGQVFTRQLKEAIETLPDGKTIWMQQPDDAGAVARSAEIAFADLDSLRRAVNSAFNGLTFYHEQEQAVVTRQQLMDTAKSFVRTNALAAPL